MISVRRTYDIDDMYDDRFRPAEILYRMIQHSPNAFNLCKRIINAINKRDCKFTDPVIQNLIGALGEIVGFSENTSDIKQIVLDVAKYYLARNEYFNFFSEVEPVHYSEVKDLVNSELIDLMRFAEIVLALDYNKMVRNFDRQTAIESTKRVGSDIPGYRYLDSKDKQIVYLAHNGDGFFAVQLEGDAPEVTVLFGTKNEGIVKEMGVGEEKFVQMTLPKQEFAVTLFIAACITQNDGLETHLLSNVDIATFQGLGLTTENGTKYTNEELADLYQQEKKDDYEKIANEFRDPSYTKQLLELVGPMIIARASLPDIDLCVEGEDKYKIHLLPCSLVNDDFFEITDVAKCSDKGLFSNIILGALPYLVDVGLFVAFKKVNLKSIGNISKIFKKIPWVNTVLNSKTTKKIVKHNRNAKKANLEKIGWLSRAKAFLSKNPKKKKYQKQNAAKKMRNSDQVKFSEWIKKRFLTKKTLITSSVTLGGLVGGAAALNALRNDVESTNADSSNFIMTSKKVDDAAKFKYDFEDVMALADLISDAFQIHFKNDELYRIKEMLDD